MAVPTYEKTDATTIGGSEGTIKITNFDKDATYILLDDQDSDTKKTLETDTFKGLAAGSYKVKVEKEGFESAVTDVITIADGKEDTFPVVEIRQPTQEGETATIKIVTPATLDSETIYELCAWDTTKNELGDVVFTFTQSNRIKTDLAIGTYKMRTRKGDQVEVAEVVIEVKVTPSVEENE